MISPDGQSPICSGSTWKGIVKLTKTRLTDPQDDGLEPVANRACWGAVSPILLNLTIPLIFLRMNGLLTGSFELP